MTDGCNQEQERSADTSDSDNDSLSLLCNLVVYQSRGGAGDMEIGDFNSQVGNKEQENEMELNQLQEPESGTSSCTQSAAGWANSTYQLAANVLQRVKIPNKSRLHKRNGKGETLLHKACKRRDLAQVKALVGAGISVNMQDYAGWSALHEASAVGDEAVVEELLESGANVNARSFDGVIPLHDAVLSGCCQVVKLLLQCGSNPSERNIGGLSALDIAEEGNIKELLLTSQASSLMHEKPCEAPAHDSQVGETSSEARCHMQLPCQSGFSHSHDDKASVQSRESGDREGAREPGDIQLGKKDTTTDNLSHLEAITVLLEEVGRKQREISTWPLVGLEDAGRYLSAVTHTHNVLVEVLTKQHLEKDNLTQKYWNVSDYLWQHGNNGQFVTLASHQRILVELLQNQMDLEEVYAAVKAKLSTQAPDSSSSTVLRQWTDNSSTPASKAAEAHSCNQNSQRKESQSPYTKACLLRSASPDDAKAPTVPTPPAPLLSQGKKTHLHADVLKKKTRSYQSMDYFQITPNNRMIQPGAEDKSRGLCKLIQREVVPPGSTLQVHLKGHWHLAHVWDDGSIKDAKGKSYLAPEEWLESILGNKTPVSSACAWDKVMFRDKPLSYYLLNMESEGNTPQTCPEEPCRAGSSQEEMPTGADGLSLLMNIKIIHLVDDEELMPKAELDYYWEKLVKSDFSESEDWWNEVLQ